MIVFFFRKLGDKKIIEKNNKEIIINKKTHKHITKNHLLRKQHKWCSNHKFDHSRNGIEIIFKKDK